MMLRNTVLLSISWNELAQSFLKLLHPAKWMSFWGPTIEILLLAVVIYYLISFFWNTRAIDLFLGTVAFLGLYGLSAWMHLPIIQKMMWYLVDVSAIAFLIIFQPELRLALSKLTLKGRKYQEVTEFDKFLDNISICVYRMAERHIGALIVLENQDSLDEFAEKGVILNAQYSQELLYTIFNTTTPLHDGGVIIRGTTIMSAATILPLPEESSQLTKSMGTRHRAGLAVSQLTDALVIVVSEESGKVSIAREGIMTKGIKVDRFKGIIRSVFTPPKKKENRVMKLLGSWG